MLYVFLFITLVLLYMYVQACVPKVNFVTVKSEKIKKDTEIRILQISDAHSSSSLGDEHFVKMVKGLDFNMIVITGDYVDDKRKNDGQAMKFLKSMMECGKDIFYVCGNHECRMEHREEMIQEMKALGVKVLNNDGEIIKINHNFIGVVGVDDFNCGKSDLPNAMKKVDDRAFTVLLSHCPDMVISQEINGIDLTLCGHTHGGQVRFPFVGAIIVPDQGWFPKYDKGSYVLNNGSNLYVDSGLGYSNLPLRFMNRSQITLLTIKK